MSGKLRVLISALLLTPAVALGLGLGEIRLNSALNQPLSAEIDLVAATPEELAALEANLASSDVFARYGLDRPAYLNSLEFTVGRGQDGRSVLLVRSRDAITEPFVSFLVDVNWPRGRLLREYTVLLDPPAMLSASESPAAAPIVAPVTTAPVAPPRPAPEEAAPASASPPAPVAQATAAVAAGSSYEVARGDTLYGIAGNLAGGDRQAIQRAMIALFRTNPEAFDGNINQLHAGAILRVPSSEEIAGVSADEAASSVREQNAAWRAAGGGQESGRLQLVTPPEGETEAAGAPPASGQVASQINALQKDIDEQKRLLELRNQELADLQRKLEGKSAHELGEGSEIDLYEQLRSTFEGDRIQRVPKGVNGADVIHEVVHNGRTCGKIVYDAKNRDAWQNNFAVKLNADKLAQGADHAILSSNKFPRDKREIHLQDGVIVAAPARVLAIVEILRDQLIRLHELRVSNEQRDSKTEDLYAFITSEHCRQLIGQVENQAGRMLDLDAKEVEAHRRVWDQRRKLIHAVQKARSDLSFEIDRIIGTAGNGPDEEKA